MIDYKRKMKNHIKMNLVIWIQIVTVHFYMQKLIE